MIKHICDKCKDEVTDTLQLQEMYQIDFRGGYASKFGDGSYVKIDLCQNCLYDILLKEGLLNETTVTEMNW